MKLRKLQLVLAVLMGASLSTAFTCGATGFAPRIAFLGCGVALSAGGVLALIGPLVMREIEAEARRAVQK